MSLGPGPCLIKKFSLILKVNFQWKNLSNIELILNR